MHYDPIKELLGRLFNRHPLLRRLFYRLLGYPAPAVVARQKDPQEDRPVTAAKGKGP